MRKFKKPESRKSDPRAGHRHSRGGHKPQPGQVQSRGGPPQIPKGRVVVGIHAVRELFKVRPQSVTNLWFKDGYDTHADLVEIENEAKRRRIQAVTHSPAALDKIASQHQGVIAYSDETPELSLGHLKDLPKSMLLVLDEVEDPHNLGAVLRTAWLFGVNGVITPETRAASLTATVSKVAQGAVEHIPVMQESGMLETLKYLKQHGYWLYGLSHKGTKSLYETEIPDKVIWVLGSESSGIRRPIEKECDELISIPQADPEASFNVSVAAAVAISETYRQHRSNSHA
jgi:23S rRNA (guanosine2251-2'-O)-methyltransferase